MSLSMRIEVTSGVASTDVPDDIAAELEEAYDALSKLPVNRQVVVDFANKQEANTFVKQGKAWAAAQEPALTFSRRENVKANPTRVAFRIYLPREKKSEK